MEDAQSKIFEIMQGLLKHTLFPDSVGRAILSVVASLIFFTSAAVLVKWSTSQIYKLLLGPLIAKFWSAERRADVRNLRAFARSAQIRLDSLNNDENFRSESYAELEAKVTVRTTSRGRPKTSRPHRRRSLAKALARTRPREGLVILEGEPGAGKSVALRRVAHQLSGDIARSPLGRGILPLYINLKGFAGPPTIDSLRAYILEFESTTSDIDIATFLADYFEKGVREKRWVFIFDSFDEIPAVLTATEEDGSVDAYAETLRTWVATTGCAAIVASRDFHGLRRQPASRRFIIDSISTDRQKQFIDRAVLDVERRKLLKEFLASAPDVFRDFIVNPLWLGLLIAHVREQNSVPSSPHEVFDQYIQERFRLARRISPGRTERWFADRRAWMETLAYIVTSDSLPLNFTLSQVRSSLLKRGLSAASCADNLRLLTQLKFLRRAGIELEQDVYTFRHRRLQEYLCARYVIRNPEAQTYDSLLTEGRWRETLVSLIQMEKDDDAHELLVSAASRMQLINGASRVDVVGLHGDFGWPAFVRHIMSILTEGLGRRVYNFPDPGRRAAFEIMVEAFRRGQGVDKLWAIRYSSLAPDEEQIDLIESGLRQPPRHIQVAAFEQASQIGRQTPSIERAVRMHLLSKWSGGYLRKDRVGINSSIDRFRSPTKLQDARLLLALTTYIDALLVVLTVSITSLANPNSPDWFAFILLAAVAHSGLYIYRAAPPWADSASRGMAPTMRSLTRYLLPNSYASQLQFFSMSICVLGRLVLMVFLLDALSASSWPFAVSCTVLCLAAYALSWVVVTPYAVRAGRFVAPPMWPAIPFFPVSQSGRLFDIVSKGWRTLKQVGFSRMCLIVALSILVSVSAMATVVGALLLLTITPPLIGALFTFVFALLFVVALFRPRYLDWRMLRGGRELRMLQDQTPEALLDVVQLLRSGYGAWRFVSFIRDKRLVRISSVFDAVSDLHTALTVSRGEERVTLSSVLFADNSRGRLQDWIDGHLATKRATPNAAWPSWRSPVFASWLPTKRMAWMQINGCFSDDCLDELIAALDAEAGEELIGVVA